LEDSSLVARRILTHRHPLVARPTPDRLQKTVLKGKGGFNPKMGEFILDFADARASEDHADTVLEFLQETYSAAADLAKWDRATLDRQE
jgi:hypothetical protein